MLAFACRFRAADHRLIVYLDDLDDLPRIAQRTVAGHRAGQSRARLGSEASRSRRADPENLPADSDGDVESLAHALHGFATRLEEFVERERKFTRDASHELRTPLTVIKVAGDMLLDDDSPPFTQRAASASSVRCATWNR